jgi:hypothetical protein
MEAPSLEPETCHECEVPGPEVAVSHPKRTDLPTFEEMYEVIGGCVVVPRE